MSRLSMRPSPLRWETLETATCGGRLSCHYTNQRAVVTDCSACGSSAASTAAAPDSTVRFDRKPKAPSCCRSKIDLIALVGRLRYVTRASVAGDPCRVAPVRRDDFGAQCDQPARPI